MTVRTVLYVLLAVVATAAAVLSFDALRGLALVCGFAWWTAPLLPAVVDAGAAAGTLAWLTGAGRARGFGRLLALVLLAASVAGNAMGHALAAYSAVPHWGLVVAVSGVAPAVLGAVVHLAVVAAQGVSTRAEMAVGGLGEGYSLVSTPLVGTPNGLSDEGSSPIPEDPGSSRPREALDSTDAPNELLGEHGLSRLWETAPPAGGRPGDCRLTSPDDEPAPALRPVQVGDTTEKDRAAELIAASAGRRRLARELNVSEHEARRLIARSRNGSEVAR